MGYSTSNPPVCVRPGFNADTPSDWVYKSTDNADAVDADGYITNAKELGMKALDNVEVIDTDASPPLRTRHTVTEINTDGSANLSNSDGSDTD